MAPGLRGDVLEVTRTVEATAPSAWAAFARYEHWPTWGPSVTAVEPASGELAAGDRGRVRTPVGGWVPFRIRSVDPGRSWSWEVGPGIPATTHRVEPLGPRRTRLVFEVAWWAAPYTVVCWVALGRLARVAVRFDRAGGGDGAGVESTGTP